MSFAISVVIAARFQSTPSARRATGRIDAQASDIEISIHALREEGDLHQAASGFQPRNISIHALREEGDPGLSGSSSVSKYFNPRPPRGGRPDTALGERIDAEFQSTPSARRATGAIPDVSGFVTISIHALREEGDPAFRQVVGCA